MAHRSQITAFHASLYIVPNEQIDNKIQPPSLSYCIFMVSTARVASPLNAREPHQITQNLSPKAEGAWSYREHLREAGHHATGDLFRSRNLPDTARSVPQFDRPAIMPFRPDFGCRLSKRIPVVSTLDFLSGPRDSACQVDPVKPQDGHQGTYPK
jgi:hypothetical protein